LWPITSRLRLAAFKPDRPVWKAMVLSFGRKCEVRESL
jgi:hypothetical protein